MIEALALGIVILAFWVLCVLACARALWANEKTYEIRGEAIDLPDYPRTYRALPDYETMLWAIFWGRDPRSYLERDQ